MKPMFLLLGDSGYCYPKAPKIHTSKGMRKTNLHCCSADKHFRQRVIHMLTDRGLNWESYNIIWTINTIMPVQDRVTFKTLCLTHKCTQGSAPQYLSEKIKPYVTNRVLRSTNQKFLQIPKSRYKSKGERRFAVQGPRLWNALPTTIRLEENHRAFRKKLKTHLF